MFLIKQVLNFEDLNKSKLLLRKKIKFDNKKTELDIYRIDVEGYMDNYTCLGYSTFLLYKSIYEKDEESEGAESVFAVCKYYNEGKEKFKYHFFSLEEITLIIDKPLNYIETVE